MTEQINIILKKQCDIIGVDFSEVDASKEDWFMLHEWTTEQENEFIEWLTNHLMESKAARTAIMQFPIKRKKKCNQTAIDWVFNYGWKNS